MTYLIDTSAWVEFFRRTESPVDHAVTQLVAEHRLEILACPPVRLELSLDPDELRRRRVLKVFDGFPLAPISDADFDTAGDIYRATRAMGHTPRVLIDCLIAAVAIRNRSQILHNDADFDRMAQAIDSLSILRLPSS